MKKELSFNNCKKDSKNPCITDKDVFLAEKLKDANFNTGFYQVPEIPNFEVKKPEGLVLWSKRKRCNNKRKYALCFYEFDCMFDGKNGIYNILKYGCKDQIRILIDEMKEFAFVICPDYSVYGNFPNYKQIDALVRSREVGYILSTYGLKVVVNYRATFEWTYELALSGFSNCSIVSVGTLGCLKEKETRKLLEKSINVLVMGRNLRAIIVYGTAPNDIFGLAIERGIEIWQFDSMISKAFRGGEQRWE